MAVNAHIRAGSLRMFSRLPEGGGRLLGLAAIPEEGHKGLERQYPAKDGVPHDHTWTRERPETVFDRRTGELLGRMEQCSFGIPSQGMM